MAETATVPSLLVAAGRLSRRLLYTIVDTELPPDDKRRQLADLLEAGASLAFTSPSDRVLAGATPLLLAVIAGDADLVEWLLRRGGDVNQAVDALYHPESVCPTALHQAAFDGRLDIVQVQMHTQCPRGGLFEQDQHRSCLRQILSKQVGLRSNFDSFESFAVCCLQSEEFEFYAVSWTKDPAARGSELTCWCLTNVCASYNVESMSCDLSACIGLGYNCTQGKFYATEQSYV